MGSVNMVLDGFCTYSAPIFHPIGISYNLFRVGIEAKVRPGAGIGLCKKKPSEPVKLYPNFLTLLSMILMREISL